MNWIRKFLNNEEESVAKAAVYYLICQLLIKGISFITTPIFSRLLTNEEFGDVSNFFSWVALLLPLVTLDLRVTINKSKYDYKKDNDSYLASILLTSNIISLLVLLVIEFNCPFFVKLFSMDIKYIRIMFLYIIFQTAFDYQQIQDNIYHKYRKYVFYTVLSTAASITLSVILVFFMDNRFKGRIIGAVIPAVIIDCIIYLNILRRIKKIKFAYVKYAIVMAVPLIPSALSSTILSTSDRVMITNMVGSRQTALYSVAYSVSSIAGILWTALNQAWSPWLFDKLNEEKYSDIKKFSKQFALLYSGLILGIMLLAPELVYIMGGKMYMETIRVMPPVILAMVFQFFYAFYFNTEYFYGETYIVSIGTTIAALVNLILNYIFIPKYGYIAAAYTTLIGYAVMYMYHYIIVRFKLEKHFIYNNGFMILLICLLTVIQIAIAFAYENIVIRYTALCIYIFLFIIAYIKNRKNIFGFIRKFVNKKEDKSERFL